MPDFQTLWWIDGLVVFGSVGVLFAVERALGFQRLWKWSIGASSRAFSASLFNA